MALRDGMGREVEEGEGGMIWENGIETCILSYSEMDHQSSSDA